MTATSTVGDETLAEWRFRRRLTQRELADLARVTPSTISKLERGQHVPRPSVVRRIAGALNVDPDLIEEFRRRPTRRPSVTTTAA